MSQTDINSTVCPFCQTSQNISADMKEEKIFCQKCGNKFEISQKGESNKYPVIGKLAVSYKFITEEQLKKALVIKKSQDKEGRKVSLAEIFAKLEMITPKQMSVLHKVKDFLELRQQDKKFAEIVIEGNPSLKNRVEKAMDMQAKVFKEKKVVRLVGDILVITKAITAEERDAILIKQNRIGSKESPGDPDTEEKSLIVLSVSEDSMCANLSITGNSKNEVTIEQIKNMLKEKEIAIGIVDDDTITKFLEAKDQIPRELKIAQGKPQQPGRDAAIKLYFDEDHLRAGEIDSEGNIDFKNRGDIPYVKAGDVLAEKIPLLEASDGIDIFGNSIITEKAKDIELLYGIGATLSEDKISVTAETDGQPLISLGRKISVFKEKIIPGDVDFNTGHVNFDGNVIIKGTIQSGFQVKSVNVNAQEVFGGIIEADGDVSISGGVIDTKIKAQGNVYATYVKNSVITSYGNLVVDKEILDSEIILGGFCQVQSGNILSTSLSAKKGIQSVNIGSDSARASKLKIGVDEHAEKEIQRIEAIISQKEETQNKLDTEIKEYKEKQDLIHDMISEMAHEQDRITRERKALDETLKRFGKKKGQRNLDHAGARLHAFDEKIKTTEETINTLFLEQDEYREKSINAKNQKQNIDNDMMELLMEKEGVMKWSQQEESIPVIRVTGSIFDRTVVTAKNSKKILNDTYNNVHLHEVKVSPPSSSPSFDIQIIQNRTN